MGKRVELCPHCREKLLFYMIDQNNTINATTCPNCLSLVWIEDGEIESDFRGGYLRKEVNYEQED
jgi:Zn-finger nucleic acid-binding protein